MKNHEKEVVCSKKDAIFKAIFGSKDGIYFLETLLKDILQKDIKIIEYMDRELPIVNITEKIKIIDLLVKVEGELIHIEVNSQSSSYIRFRNFIYFAKIMVSDQRPGKRYSYNQKYLSINLTSGLSNSYELIEIYKIKNDKGVLFTDNVSIYEVNLDKAKELCYNGDASEKVKHIATLSMSRTEIEKYKGGDEFMEKLSKKLNDMQADDIWFATPEEDYQRILETEKEIAREEGHKEGQEEGQKDEQKKIAKNMLKEKISKDIIIKCTGVSMEELNQLLN